MALARFTLTILFALISLGNHAAAQVNERVHEIANHALEISCNWEDERSKAIVLGDVAKVFARNREQELADEIFREAVHRVPDDKAWQLKDIAISMAEAGFYETALVHAERFERTGLDSSAYAPRTEIAIIMARRNDWEEALSLLEEIPNPTSKARILTEFSILKFASGKTHTAMDFLDDAAESTASIGKWRVASVLNQVRALVAEGMTEFAKKLVSSELEGAKTDLDWIFIMDMEAECGNVEGVLRIGDELNRNGYWQRGKANRIAKYLAKAQTRAGLLDEARETVKGLTGDDFAFASRHLAEAYIEAQRFEEAIAVIETLEKSGLWGWLYEESLLDVSRAYWQQGEESRAVTLLKKVRVGGRGWVQSIGRCYGQFGLDSEAETWIETLDSPDPMAIALISLANGILDREQKSK